MRRGRRTSPYAFTELGIAMLSSVLNSERAVQVNIAIMGAFVKLRQLLATHADLARRLDELEAKYDKQFRVVFQAIRELMGPEPVPAKRRIGFLDRSENRRRDHTHGCQKSKAVGGIAEYATSGEDVCHRDRYAGKEGQRDTLV